MEEFPTELKYGGDVTTRFGTVDSEKTEMGNFWMAGSRANLTGGVTFQDVGETRGPGVVVMQNTGFNAGGGIQHGLL